jgi:hypothetical protein
MKNALGLGPGATGSLLGVLFFGVYFSSAALAKRVVMRDSPNPERPQYFRDIQVVTSESQKQKDSSN